MRGLIVAAVLASGPVSADLTDMMLPFNLTCGPTHEVYEHGYEKYGEVPSFMATSDEGRRIVWSLNDDASAMSLIISDPDGTSCVIWSTYCPPGECLSPAINLTENAYDKGL